MSIDNKELGKAIAEIRQRRGMTQKAVAEHTGLTANYLSLLENGERSVSIDTLNRLAEVFRVPPECIVFLGGKPRRGSDALTRLSQETRNAIRAAITEDE